MAEWLSLREVASTPVQDRVVAVSPQGRTDHAAFHRRVAEWSAAFAARVENDWALYDEDAIEFAAALFGAWHAGKRVFLVGDALPATLENVGAHVQGFAGGGMPGSVSPLSATPADNGAHALYPLDPLATQLVVFTSGSTGLPQAIDKRLQQLESEIEALQQTFGDGLEDAIVHGTVSHQHIYGLLFRVLWPLAAGRPVAPRSFFHEEFIAAVAASAAPVLFVSSPAHLKRMPEGLDWPGVHGKLRAVFSSGGALPQDAALTAKRLLGIAPAEIFGSSETGGIAWRRWDDASPAWRALPGVQWRLDGDVLEVDSPHLAATGWWRTPDRAEAAGEGFRLLGRADRIVKIEERRVSLDALERALAVYPWVREVRVLALGGARMELAAVVVPTSAGVHKLHESGRQGLVKLLGAALAGSFDAVTRPRRWRFVDALPLDAQGKTTQAALEVLFRPAHPQPHWLKRDPDAAELEIQLDPRLLVFDGHFPQVAILPGVAQADWAIRFARQAFPLPPRFLRLEALKFQQVARPGQTLCLQLEWNSERATLAFRYVSALGVHAGGRAVFAHE